MAQVYYSGMTESIFSEIGMKEWGTGETGMAKYEPCDIPVARDNWLMCIPEIYLVINGARAGVVVSYLWPNYIHSR